MSESSCDSISNSMLMTCFCGEITHCFTSRTLLNSGRRFYRCYKSKFFSIFLDQIENCRYWRWEDSSPGNTSIEVNLLKSKLKSLNAVKFERDNLKKKLENLDSLNYFEVNKSRNLKAKVSKLKMLCILSFIVFVVFVVAIFK
ncbi:hypothetical protein R3W88_029441 [Solanum pinnatisectum]|uniref:GRF-type domain-containing protein n=1 Tax=Solanum pinnatisectum TaxID=50273 RepID=A0AAV9K5Q2_9SOLN|nr:hypothetical protein R3W88_029441 [Solanum pinnatisectum]